MIVSVGERIVQQNVMVMETVMMIMMMVLVIVVVVVAAAVVATIGVKVTGATKSLFPHHALSFISFLVSSYVCCQESEGEERGGNEKNTAQNQGGRGRRGGRHVVTMSCCRDTRHLHPQVGMNQVKEAVCFLPEAGTKVHTFTKEAGSRIREMQRFAVSLYPLLLWLRSQHMSQSSDQDRVFVCVCVSE